MLSDIFVSYSTKQHKWGSFDKGIDQVRHLFLGRGIGKGTNLTNGWRDIQFRVEEYQVEYVKKELYSKFGRKIRIKSSAVLKEDTPLDNPIIKEIELKMWVDDK